MRNTLLALAMSTAITGTALADELLEIEHADVVRLPSSASTVIIGNPAIADAVIHDRRTLIVTGRLFGRTNVIALDRSGRVIYAEDFVVGPSRDAGQVTVMRGNSQSSLTCTPNCAESPTVGDDQERFDMLTGQQSNRLGVASEAASISEGDRTPRSLDGGRN